MNNPPNYPKGAGLLPPPPQIPIQKMAKKGHVVKQPAKAKAAKAKAKAKARAHRYRPGERAIREIRLMQRTVTPAIPNAPFYRVVSRHLMLRY